MYSPVQANALWLRQEVSQREAAVERAYMRLEAGQPPDEATELQWQQLLREQLATKKVTVIGDCLAVSFIADIIIL